MGAWGHQTFENDGACDFAIELCREHAQNPDYLLTVLSWAEDDEYADYIEVDMAQYFIAAAHLLTLLYGVKETKETSISSELQQWVATNQHFQSDITIDKAIVALQRVLSDGDQSEMYELWQETDYFVAWKQAVQQHLDALITIKNNHYAKQ